MRGINLILLLSCLIATSVSANESGTIQVIVNGQSELQNLNKKQVMSLFLGRARNFPNGKVAKPIDNEIGSSIRKDFFESLTGKSISDIDAYWARLRYSGRASPPKSLSSEDAVLKAVKTSKNAIGYVSGKDPAKLAAEGLTVVHAIKGK